MEFFEFVYFAFMCAVHRCVYMHTYGAFSASSHKQYMKLTATSASQYGHTNVQYSIGQYGIQLCICLYVVQQAREYIMRFTILHCKYYIYGTIECYKTSSSSSSIQYEYTYVFDEYIYATETEKFFTYKCDVACSIVHLFVGSFAYSELNCILFHSHRSCCPLCTLSTIGNCICVRYTTFSVALARSNSYFYAQSPLSFSPFSAVCVCVCMSVFMGRTQKKHYQVKARGFSGQFIKLL